MSELPVAPNFEKTRKEFCQKLAYQLRNPALTNEKRLEILERLDRFLAEEMESKG